MATMLHDQLDIGRCPHCRTGKPSMIKMWEGATRRHDTGGQRCWRLYRCTTCGGLVTASSFAFNGEVMDMFPSHHTVSDMIPPRAREYLRQGYDSLHSPAGAVMLAASAVDEMLKGKAYKNGSLYARIEEAKTAHLITADMAKWAHQVRLDANDQRHSDEESTLPVAVDAKRSLEFATALAEILYVLPSRVTRGLKDTASAVGVAPTQEIKPAVAKK